MSKSQNDLQALHLLPATKNDVDALHQLFCLPTVYKYMADGSAPPKSVAQEWIDVSVADFAQQGIGLWLLMDADRLAGAVRMEVRDEPKTAELSYLLRPDYWGQGLATRMSWTAITHAFEGAFDTVFAGVDGPNTGSIAVTRRLGMRHFKAVDYPTGPGNEYVVTKTDARPDPEPKPIPFSGAP